MGRHCHRRALLLIQPAFEEGLSLNGKKIASVLLWDADILKTERNVFSLIFEGKSSREVFAFGLF